SFAFWISGEREGFGYFLIAWGAYMLLNGLSQLRYFWKIAKIFRGIQDAASKARVENKDATIWEVGEDGLRFKDLYYDNRVKWGAFRGYTMVKGNLLLMLKETINQYYIIGKDEVSAEEFERVLAVVKTKMPLVTF